MADEVALPRPDPALKRLDRLVGSWAMEGNLVGSNEKNIKGENPAGGHFAHPGS
jgi:hypothetical protein